MNAESNVESSFAVHCDLYGNIIKTLRNDSEISFNPGQSLHYAIEQASLEKFSLFLSEIKDKQASFNWEINISVNNKIETFYFFGSRTLDSLMLVVGAFSEKQASQGFYEELMQINNEQINMLRTALKNQAIQNSQKHLPDGMYEDIAALNNELVNAQRELAKKNAALDECNRQLKQSIHEVEQTRDSLTHSNAQLNELHQQKDRFLGMVSHDLRNPLGVIKSVSELLLEENNNDEQLDLIQMIQDSSSQMLSLVNELLNIVKVQRAVIDLECKEVDVEPFIQKIIKNQQLLAHSKNIKIGIEVGDDVLKTLYCDPKRIEQVLINLLGNAIKFSYLDSEVLVQVQNTQGKTQISVIDSGQGIAPQEQEKVFGEFQQAASHAIASEEGFGLGLVICKKIIELHGGKIGVESQLGKGCRFYFIL